MTAVGRRYKRNPGVAEAGAQTQLVYKDTRTTPTFVCTQKETL